MAFEKKEPAGGKKKNPILQFLQFNLVGIINTIVDFLVYGLLNGLLHVPYLLAQTVSYSCGVANSYFMNSRWTFREQNKNSKKQLLLFIAVNLLSLGVSLLVLWFCEDVIQIPDILGISSRVWCKCIATVASVAVNFIGNKLLVFKE